MAISNTKIRELAEGLNTQFSGQQAATILALANAAKDEAIGGVVAVPALPTANGKYVLNITGGVATWVVETA